MSEQFSWTDAHGVVHCVVEEALTGFVPPRALMKLCQLDATWVHGKPGYFGHIESGEIRAANRQDPVTCLVCLARCRTT